MAYKLHVDNMYFSVQVDNLKVFNFEISEALYIKQGGGGILEFGGMSFEVQRKGWENYDVWFSNEYFEIMFDSRYQGSESHLPIYIQLHSKGILETGLRELYESILWFIEQFGCRVLRTKLSRLDPACDTDEFKLTEKHLNKFIRRSRIWGWMHDIRLVDHDERFDAFGIASVFTGFYFGKRGGTGTFCRVYLKSVEIQKHQKEYMLEAWTQWGFQKLDQVWRIEFELHRDRLKELGFDQAEDVFSQKVNWLWDYLTTDYIRLVNKKDKQHPERSIVNPKWIKIAKLKFNSNEKVQFSNRNLTKKEQLQRLLVGSLTSLASEEFKSGKFTKDNVLDLVWETINQVCSTKGSTLNELILDKKDKKIDDSYILQKKYEPVLAR